MTKNIHLEQKGGRLVMLNLIEPHETSAVMAKKSPSPFVLGNDKSDNHKGPHCP